MTPTDVLACSASYRLSFSCSRLTGKVALITGGASGIGEATVKLFIKHGAKVCIADIHDDRGEQLCESFGGGKHALFFHCDVSKEDDVSKAVDFTVETFGMLDILVNNAGITGHKVLDIREVDFREFKVFEINVDGVFLGKVTVPDKCREGASNTTMSGGRMINENKLLSKKKRLALSRKSN